MALRSLHLVIIIRMLQIIYSNGQRALKSIWLSQRSRSIHSIHRQLSNMSASHIAPHQSIWSIERCQSTLNADESFHQWGPENAPDHLTLICLVKSSQNGLALRMLQINSFSRKKALKYVWLSDCSKFMHSSIWSIKRSQMSLAVKMLSAASFHW